ncbi:hypothetical protein ILUMI_21550 [Ignelater luminosus]|uniref:Acyl-CoA-binding domain-containing protein 6 n=1 Tax=Ignelater luminosus TaxID=2038154 RepID=A0A8K0CEC0_IGNLU|nr:hypothetical protein ILUMI_21550 [Ignelater luminosus]
MAYAVDNSYEADLEELTADTDEINEKFTRAAEHLKTLLPKIDSGTLLNLYGYYKQGTEGSCNIPRPNWYNTQGKAKWDAWNKLGNMSRTDSQRLYVEMIERLDPNFATAKTSSKEGWVTISTMHTDEKMLNDSEKSLTDYVKEGNSNQVRNILESLKLEEVTNLLNRLDEDGLGLIHWAADRGSSEILDTIIAFGANVNLVDVDNQTALHYASSCGHVDCIKVLLHNRINVNVKDSDGLDAKSVASDDNVKELLNAVA